MIHNWVFLSKFERIEVHNRFSLLCDKRAEMNNVNNLKRPWVSRDTHWIEALLAKRCAQLLSWSEKIKSLLHQVKFLLLVNSFAFRIWNLAPVLIRNYRSSRLFNEFFLIRNNLLVFRWIIVLRSDAFANRKRFLHTCV